MTDEGTLSSNNLPIYGLSYGGSFTPYSSVQFNIGPLICSGKKGSYPSETERFEKEKLNRKLLELTNEIEETKEDLNALSDQAEEVKNQNLNSKINDLRNNMTETKEDLNQLSAKADEIKQQNLDLRLKELESEIKKTQEDLDAISDQAKEVQKQNLNSKINS